PRRHDAGLGRAGVGLRLGEVRRGEGPEYRHAVLWGLRPTQGPPARVRFHRGASRRGREGPIGPEPTGRLSMRIALAADHGGYDMKQTLIARLRQAGPAVTDFGAATLDPGADYPDYVIPLARAVAAGEVDRGIVICGSGVGASVAANKVKGIRAGLCHDHY